MATEQQLRLVPPVITHGVVDMVRKVQFSMRVYASLTSRESAFLFIVHMASSAKRLNVKARL